MLNESYVKDNGGHEDMSSLHGDNIFRLRVTVKTCNRLLTSSEWTSMTLIYSNSLFFDSSPSYNKTNITDYAIQLIQVVTKNAIGWRFFNWKSSGPEEQLY